MTTLKNSNPTDTLSALTSTQRWSLFLLNLVFLFILPLDNLLNLGVAWQADEYSHGPLIPFIALLIGWHRLTEKRPEISSSWSGVAVLLCATALIAVSRLSAFEPPAHYGFIVSLFGLTLSYFGKRLTMTLIPAFAYLFFAIPLPRLIYVTLSAEMQLWSSSLGVFLLHFLGISVFQEGNIIDLGGYKLQVVEACNGLRYLFPLMSFGFLMALLFEDKLWKRSVLFLSTIPITIGMNALRIAFVGLTVNQWGTSMAEGLLHEFEGWAIFSVCVLLLFGELKLLSLLNHGNSKNGHFRYDYLGRAHGPLAKGPWRPGLPAVAVFLLSGLAAFVFGTGFLDSRQESAPQKPPFHSFPLRFSDWRGTSDAIDSQTLATLKLDDYWLADYRQENETAPPVNLYIAYYKSQRVGSSIHSPSNCLPGGGWRIENRSVAPIALPLGITIPVSRLLIKEDRKTMLVYYWFAGRNRILTEQYEAKWYLLIDSITHGRTDGALVRLTTALDAQETEQNADKRLQTFLTLTYPELKQFIP